MGNFSNLYHAIEDLLVYITKADPYNTLARNIFKALDKQWTTAQAEFIDKLIKKIKYEGKKAFSPDEIDAWIGMADMILGADFSAKIEAEIADNSAAAYKIAHKEVGVEFEHNIEDKRALKWLAEDTMYWIGDHYENGTRAAMRERSKEIMEQGMSREQAGLHIAGAFPERVRTKVYWEGLANHLTTRSREFGRVSAYGNAKAMYLKVTAVMDWRTSEICKQMNGRIIKVSEARALRDELLATPATPEGKKAIKKTIAPWLRPKQINDLVIGKPSNELPRGLALPPYHYNCRTRTVIAYADELPGAAGSKAAGNGPLATPKAQGGALPLPNAENAPNAQIDGIGATQSNYTPQPSPAQPKVKKPKTPKGKPAAATTEQLAGTTPADAFTIPEPTHDAAGFPVSLDTLEKVTTLGGSTGALLMEDRLTKERFVVKRGASAEHLIEEATADEIYRAMGVKVPDFRLIKGPNGEPTKIAKFIDGKTLADFEAEQDDPAIQAMIHKAIKKNFVADALMGNWDVVGLGKDNIIINRHGEPYRIDNGGSLRFRAMGARKTAQQFGPAVTELQTLLDPNTNPQTAAIFGSLTPAEIHAQIRDIAGKRKAILEATPDDLKDTMKARIDFLEGQLPAQAAAPKKPRAKKPAAWDTPEAAGGISQKFADAVAAARMNGKVLFSDRGDIEDNQILLWNEEPLDGTAASTHATLKLTAAACRKLDALIQKHAGSIGSSGPHALGTDTFYTSMLKMVKTLNTHAADGNYNPDTVVAYGTTEALLKNFAKTATGPDKKMADHYHEMTKKINAAMTAQKAIAERFEQYMHTPAANTTPDNSGPWDALRRGNLEFYWKKIKKGFVEQYETKNGSTISFTTAATGNTGDETFIMKIDGVEINYTPQSNNRKTFRGMINAKAAGKVTADTLNKITAALQRLEIDTATPSDAWSEFVYLKKGAIIRADVFSQRDYEQIDSIESDATLTDAQRVDAMKKLITYKMPGINIPDKPGKGYDYRPKANAFGEGYATNLYRWDLPPDKVEKEMKGYGIAHNVVGESIDRMLNSVLDNGGFLSPVAEMLRKGMGKGPGISPEPDLRTGGSAYSFTRILKTATINGGSRGDATIVFKKRNLARMDAHSFDGDWMGGISDIYSTQIRASRYKDIAGFKECARTSSNETLFKHGLSIIEELDAIRADSDDTRNKIITIFKNHGYHTLPDGRKIEDVIVKEYKG